MIRVSKLSKIFGELRAVDRISFNVQQGETLVLLGTSGCGKTTTLKMINRLIEPSEGTVHINEQDIREQQPETLRRSIGYVIQNIGLFPHYSVEQNVSLVPRLLQWENQKIRDRTRELLDMVGLEADSYSQRYPDELSGGQQQRVGLARALAADPPLILLDEPFGALDPITRRDLQHEFKQLETFLHKTMILVSHDVFESFDLGDRICLMDQGQIQQIGTGKKMLFKPENEFVRDFFKANRFQLELKVMTLADVLPELPETSFEKGDLSCTETMDCLSMLEQAEQHPQDQPVVTITEQDTGEPLRYIKTGDLLSVFPKAKTKLIEKL